MSHFAKSNGPFCGDDAATAAISLGAAFPNCFIASGCACTTVAALTLGRGIPPTWISNERSRIARYGRLWCGTAASGEIFKFAGGLASSSLQGISFAKPCCTFSNVSSRRHRMASGVFADGCAPRSTAARS